MDSSWIEATSKELTKADDSGERMGNGGQPDLAILAFGSLVSNPGLEITEVVSHPLDGLTTPFDVEYARSSSTRGGAPTLVPVASGGCPVRATAFVIEPGIGLEEVRDRLYRREINRVGADRSYSHTDTPEPGHVWLPTTDQVARVGLAVYTALEDNIPLEKRTPGHLASLSVGSVALADPGRDGISYLEANLAAGIVTPLSHDYEAAILERTGTETLAAARLSVS